MDSRPVVLDISSDEEGWEETRRDAGCAAAGHNFDWISEMLDGDVSDDVVLVSEVVLNKPKPKSPLVNDLDDDCVVLDGDPDKPAVVENVSAGDSDDLLVVGEKGPVACRDFPHSRHLCASFPFGSTPHDTYCHQCHCYVCDSLAPCLHWGNGKSSVDHCHATDKDEFWKRERKNFKQGPIAPLPVPKLRHTPVQVPSLTMKQSNPLSQNQITRPAILRACSAATNFDNSNIRNHGRNHPAVTVSSRSKFNPHMISQQLLSSHSNTIRRDRRHPVGNVGPQIINPPSIFKRKGSGSVGLATNRSGYSSGHNNHITRQSLNLPPVATSNKNPSGWQDFSTEIISDSYAYQTPSQQISGGSSVISGPSQPQVSSYPGNNSVFVNPVPCEPEVPSQSNIDSNPVPFQPPSDQQNFERSIPSQVQVSSHPNMDSSFVNLLITEHEGHGQHTSSMNMNQNGLQQGIRTQIALAPCFSDFDMGWDNSADRSNQQPLTANSQVQDVGDTYHDPFLDPQIAVNTNQNPVAIDLQFNNWILDESEFNVYSPPTDTGLFFDF